MKKNTISVILIIIISIISVVLFSHIDCAYICEWSIQLMDHILKGTLSSYANDLNAIGMGVNYSLFSIIVNAVFLLPVYIINVFVSVDLIVFEFWLKLMILGVNVLTSYIVYQICQIYKKEKILSIGVSCLFLLSPFVQIFSVGMGQIECMSVLFVTLGIKCFLKEEYLKASIFAGVSLLFKTFAVFVVLPVVLLYFKKSVKSFICTAFVVAFYILDKVISYVLIPGFYVKTSATNSADFLSRVFEVNVNSIYIYLAIVFTLCAICLYLNFEKKVDKDTWYVFSLLFFASFFVFVNFSIHWMLLFFILIVLGLIISGNNNYYKLLLIFGVNIAASIVSVIGCISVVTAVYPGRSVLSLMVGRVEDERFVSTAISDWVNGYEYSAGFALTLLVALIIVYVFLVICEYKKHSYIILNDTNKVNSSLISLNFVPVIMAYGVIGVYYYFG